MIGSDPFYSVKCCDVSTLAFKSTHFSVELNSVKPKILKRDLLSKRVLCVCVTESGGQSEDGKVAVGVGGRDADVGKSGEKRGEESLVLLILYIRAIKKGKMYIINCK